MTDWLDGLIRACDVTTASQMMGLGPNAFAPVEDDDSRFRAMLTLDTADFEACPGSGKTTVLVAKLAVLAMRWPHRQQGICVLSHTNAARREIEGRLGNSTAGKDLLRYPHFIGTIHSFVNEFLAVPWLRSKGYPIRAIDTQIALRKRLSLLNPRWRYAMEQRNLTPYCLAYDRSDFTGGSKGSLGVNTPTYQALVAAARESSELGYFCFDEMFVWANELLDKRPEVAGALRARFPLVFVDEAQDNSQEQAALLYRIFTSGDSPSRRQRFGDSNQAIYSRAEQTGAQIDQFPSLPTFSLPRSYRFGQVQADHVKGFGVVPQSLIGAGPADISLRTEPLPPVMFLFDDQSVSQVLSRYAEHILANFSSAAISRGLFKAVAAVHKLDKDTEVPRAIGHYMPTYSPASAHTESRPDSFVQYLDIARMGIASSSNASGLVSALASAVLAMVSILGASPPFVGRKSSHRKILELLDGAPAGADYAWLVEYVLSRRGLPLEADWSDEIVPRVRRVVGALSGHVTITSEAEIFLAWPSDRSVHGDGAASVQPQINTYSYPNDAPTVHIRLGSIHSIKGETHTGTLVLESYYFQHNLRELKPWLLGERQGGSRENSRRRVVTEGARMLSRLRLHYVAMTRPTHLLCLAMRRDSFSTSELEQLTTRGWEVVDCSIPARR